MSATYNNNCCGCIKPRCGQQPITEFECTNDGRDIEFIGLEQFLPRVTLVAKGIPDDVAIEYIRQACQTVSRNSGISKRDLNIYTQNGVNDYYLDNGDEEQIALIHEIRYGKECINQSLPYSLSCSPGGCFVPLKSCRNNEFEFEPPDKIIIKKTPGCDSSKIHVKYLAMPSQSCCSVDKLLYDKYQDVITNGALADVLLMRQYGYADPQMAQLYDVRFKQGISRIKIDVCREFETGTQLLVSRSRV